MADYDLTSRIAPHLDRHLVFPLLEFLQERELYADDEILKAKIQLLSQTNMVDYAMDIHKALYHTEDVPQDMVGRRVEVVARLKSLEESAAPLISFLQNASLVQELRPDKQYNIQMLHDRFQIGADQIEALYQYAKFQFECEILMQNWDTALEELNRLKEIIDSKSFASPLNQLQNRIWLMHWSLFIFFNHENGRNGIIDLFFQDRYLNAIQTNAHHLLRYVATAVIVNKRRRNMLKELVKVIQQEQHSYKDPITEFLECLYVNYDFDGAQMKLKECEQVILNDPFLGKRVEDSNFATVPLRDEFLENARLFVFETYCRIHRCIDISVLAEKLNLNMSYDEALLWITNLIRNSKLEAKIDAVLGTVTMPIVHQNVHEQIIEAMKNLNMRTYLLAKNIVEPAQAAQATR
ncbi:hypothetical protein OPV22_034114 [Ensete ventricosum]|uniref:Eukaryotic translation initiation factor 3 subunit E n=1 Tax=Ensete ventricosum TaxID=4639 RepID=A0AAV8PWD7_ENSVE|nr:hypothetical protein OPV22_034114 [Ensete ventricosum]